MRIPNWLKEAFSQPGIRTTRAIIVFGFHGLAAVAVLIIMRVVKLASKGLFGGDLLVFGLYPLDWAFQVIDLGLVAVLGYNGIREAIEAYRKDIE